MSETVIRSRANPLVRELRALAQKKVRAQRGEFLVEGIQAVLQAIESGAEIRLLIVAPDLLTSKVARDAVRTQERAGLRVVEVTQEVFASLAEREHPTGLAAVAKIKTHSLDGFRARGNDILVALNRVSNPGNLGTILRTADAVRAQGVVLIGDVTDPYAPTALNAARGAVFTVPLFRASDAEGVLAWARANNFRIVTTSDRAEQTLWNADLRPPLILLFGNEGEGLPEQLLEQGQAVRIPMAGRIDSLNLAVAAGVLLYECVRQAGGRPDGE